MTATDVLETDLLALLFTNSNANNIGDTTGLLASATAGNFRISLHTAALTDTSVQNTTEAAYGAYARVSVARAAAQWTVAGTTPTTVDNDNAITFPQATSGAETETAFGIGAATSGVGFLKIFGALSSTLAVSNGIKPEFAAGSLDISLD